METQPVAVPGTEMAVSLAGQQQAACQSIPALRAALAYSVRSDPEQSQAECPIESISSLPVTRSMWHARHTPLVNSAPHTSKMPPPT